MKTVLIYLRGPALLRVVEDWLHSVQLVDTLTTPQKTQQSEGLPGDLQQEKKVSSLCASVKSHHLEGSTGGLIQLRLQAYLKT